MDFYKFSKAFQKNDFIHLKPNLSLKSDPACIAFCSLSSFRYLGSAHPLGAGVAA